MLSLDSRGHLKPYQAIPSNISEIKSFFVDGIKSNTRIDNFKKYIHYSKDLKKLLGGITLKQWINGSFATRKSNPKDIDFVTFLDHEIIKKNRIELYPFTPAGCWEIYGVDAYIIEVYPTNDHLHKFTKVDVLEWQELFTTARINRKGEKHRKGFLEVFY